MIYVGTSGFSFRDWVGPFYPPGTRSGEMLSFYQRRFPAVEINATYYRLPSPATFQRMVDFTPPEFRFTVKLTGSLTHGEVESAEFARFLEATAPLREAERLDGILAQFPYRFREGRSGRERLRELSDHLRGHPVFVEFRHRSWAREETFRLLQELGLGFTVVDEPELQGLFPPIVRQVGETAYFRFHGRNAEQWWDGDASSRYDYLYSEEELRAWADKILDTAARTRQTLVFFNNCHGGSAPRNAEQMTLLLRELGSGEQL